jgi:hypothetical protein
MNNNCVVEKWVVDGSILAFPHRWQRPAKTEEWVYEVLKKNPPNSKFVEFICFPWATLIDLIDRKKYERAKILIDRLKELPPKKTLIRATACQHINIEKIIPYLNSIKITDLFWAHKTINIDKVEAIRIHPMALYPVMFYEHISIKQIEEVNRKYLYSFIGAYDPNCYISDIRKKIYEIPFNEKSIVVQRDKWHYEVDVYDVDINQNEVNEETKATLLQRAKEYKNTMVNSKYSLCPSGSGPNSIRIWEALALGTIPVVLSDSLDLPEFVNKTSLLKVKENDLNFFLVDIELNNRGFRASLDETIEPELFLQNITSDLFTNNFLKFFLSQDN